MQVRTKVLAQSGSKSGWFIQACLESLTVLIVNKDFGPRTPKRPEQSLAGLETPIRPTYRHLQAALGAPFS